MRNRTTERKKELSLLMFPVALVALLGWGPMADSGISMLAPEITGQSWLNAAPTRLADLKGKVVLVEFWTFGCYNCRNIEPHVKEWHGLLARASQQAGSLFYPSPVGIRITDFVCQNPLGRGEVSSFLLLLRQ